MNGINKYNVANLLGKIFLIIGLGFLLGLILFIFPETEIKLVGIIFSIIGFLFASMGAIFLYSDFLNRKKVIKLKDNGLCYECEIVKIYENIYQRINYRSPIIIECVYKDKQGNNCLVKSKNIWLDYNAALINKNEIKAKVWVNPDNPKDYYVEAYTDMDLKGNDIKVDYDYR